MPLILAALAAIPLVVFLPKLRLQIAALPGGSVDESSQVPAPSAFSAGDKEPEYPARMELQNADGTNLKVVLLSRSRTKIRFLRVSDRSEHIYSIGSLAPMSRKKVEAYPVTGIDLGKSAAASSVLSRDEIYIEQLREKNRKLKQEIELLQLEAYNKDQHDTKIRKDRLKEQIKRNELNIAKREQSL